MSGLVWDTCSVQAGSAVSLLPCYLIEMYKENQTLHKYAVYLGRMDFFK